MEDESEAESFVENEDGDGEDGDGDKGEEEEEEEGGGGEKDEGYAGDAGSDDEVETSAADLETSKEDADEEVTYLSFTMCSPVTHYVFAVTRYVFTYHSLSTGGRLRRARDGRW